MPKNQIKPEAAEPVSETASSNPGDQNDLAAYSEKTALGGPIPVVMGGGRMACKMKLSGKILEASGLKANDKVELMAGDGQILIKKIGEPAPGLYIQGCSAAKKQLLDTLMAETRAFEAEQRAAREQRYASPEEPEDDSESSTGGAAPLNLEQISEEEL